ncbi:CPBP family intramembrane glutamic endopeptidase [Luteococcus peritonei]|uniref:CPBP family intramembrane glutamic endopeptidase n=1 Tax=Luteococcus peritonei TaxID=88874 RepID=A0ABW4RS62_9ACTN
MSAAATDLAQGRPEHGVEGGRVDRRAVAVFLAVAFGLAWAGELVLALTGGLQQKAAAIALPVIMFTPMVASLVACRMRRRPWARSVGLGRESFSDAAARRILGFGLASILLLLLASGLVVTLADLAGWLPLDAGLPGLGPVMDQLPREDRPPAWVLLALQLASIPVAAFTINGLFALGEEVGWRGWLLDALMPLGRSRAVLLVGAIWGLWHAPLIAMGYEYSHQVPFLAGVLLFTCFCTALGVLMAWLRLRTGSVLTAAVGHGALNASAGLPALFVAPGELRWAWGTIVGVPGVLVVGGLAVLLLTRARWSVPQG